ncbi:MAG: MBL fold metallo-hydrolase [Elusimicrobiota bacterium]
MKVSRTGIFIVLLLLINLCLLQYFISRYTEIYTDFFYPKAYESKFMSVRFFSLGNNDSCLVKTPTGKYILIDTGRLLRELPGQVRGDRSEVMKYLLENEIYALDKIIITNPNHDYIGSLLYILMNIPVGEIIDGIGKGDTIVYKDVLAYLKRHPEIEYKRLAIGKVFDLDPFLKLRTLGPLEQYDNPRDTDSFVFKLEYDKIGFLFGSDITSIAAADLTKYGPKLRSNIMKYPHHGLGGSWSYPFIYFVKPEVMIVSGLSLSLRGIIDAGITNANYSFGSKIYSTEDGDIVITTDGKKYKISKDSM